MTAEYEVLETCFIAPHKLKAGAIIRTSAPPAGHLRPLNDEAKAAMEGWYNKEVEEKDSCGKVLRVVKPNASKRPVSAGGDPADLQTVELIQSAPAEAAATVGVTQERILAGTAGDLVPTGEGVALAPIVAEDGTQVVKPAPVELKAK